MIITFSFNPEIIAALCCSSVLPLIIYFFSNLTLSAWSWMLSDSDHESIKEPSWSIPCACLRSILRTVSGNFVSRLRTEVVRLNNESLIGLETWLFFYFFSPRQCQPVSFCLFSGSLGHGRPKWSRATPHSLRTEISNYVLRMAYETGHISRPDNTVRNYPTCGNWFHS